MNQPATTRQPRSIGSDIRLLGEMLGQTLIDQEGLAHFELEEQIRQLFKQRRAGSVDAASQLNDLLQSVTSDPAATCTILKAFTSWFYLVNLADVRQRVRVLRKRQLDAELSDTAMDETILAAMRETKSTNPNRKFFRGIKTWTKEVRQTENGPKNVRTWTRLAVTKQ